jgi:hypothetical protein
MSNHGVVTYGDTIEHAYMKMETVEHFAQIALVTHLLGRQQPLTGVDIEKLLLARTKYFGAKIRRVDAHRHGQASRKSQLKLASIRTPLQGEFPNFRATPRCPRRQSRGGGRHISIDLIAFLIILLRCGSGSRRES